MATRLRFLKPEALHKPTGYSHVVEAIGPGRIVYLAGQLGIDGDGKLVGEPGDFRAQAIQTFENIKHALAEVGATFNDVVKVTNYFTDLTHVPTFRDVRNMYVNTSAPPAATSIKIAALMHEQALLEVDVIALLPATAARAAARSRRVAKSQKSKVRKKAKRK